MGHRENVAMRKAGNLPGFEFYSWQVIGTDAVMMKGCVSKSVYVKGPRKAQPKYDGDEVCVVVAASEVAAERVRYSAETGNCAECMGEGRVVTGIGISGTTYRECRECASTGKHHASEVTA